MPDLYNLEPITPERIALAVGVQSGNPLWMGWFVGWTARYATLGAAAIAMGEYIHVGFGGAVDRIHPNLSPDQDFMEELRFTSKGYGEFVTGHDVTENYVPFDRFEAMGRAMIFYMITKLVRMGFGGYLLTFGAGWLARAGLNSSIDRLNDNLDEYDARLDIIDLSNTDDITTGRVLTELTEVKRYLNLLGDSIRLNTNANNIHLDAKSLYTETPNTLPEWPEY